MLFKILKFVLTPFRFISSFVILFFDRLLVPKSLERPPEKQAQVDAATSQYVLYHFQACPFCVKVRRHIKRLGLKIAHRDILADPQFEKQLVEGGGERQVPCLRIPQEGGSFEWKYESSDINEYLTARFAN